MSDIRTPLYISDEYDNLIVDRDGNRCATTYGDKQERSELARHIVACVNACVGQAERDEALLRQALAALEQARRELRVVWTTTTPEIIDAIDALKERT